MTDSGLNPYPPPARPPGRAAPGHLEADEPVSLTRRRLLQAMMTAGAAGVVGVGGWGVLKGNEVETLAPSSNSPKLEIGSSGQETLQVVVPEATTSTTERVQPPSPAGERILVLIELQGGNDGPSTVVPYAEGRYQDLRGDLAVNPGSVHPIDDRVGLHPNLARIAQQAVSTVEGVGPVDGVLSHFEMAARWERGDISGTNHEYAGFLARLTDALDVGAPVTGLSVAGYTPQFNKAKASVLSVERPESLRVISSPKWVYPDFRRLVPTLGSGPEAEALAASWTKVLAIGQQIDPVVSSRNNEDPMVVNGKMLGRQLQLAAAIINANLGVRVIHASLNGFDTHSNHTARHDRLMTELDAAVGGFVDIMAQSGYGDRVLVATTSEFGRRATTNGSGLDHGSASAMLMIGPVPRGRYGEPSPLNSFDENDNLKTTVSFDRYLASLAQDWLGVEAASVLPNSPSPLGFV